MTLPRLPIRLASGLALFVASTLNAQPVQNIVLRNSFSPIGAGARGLGMGGAFIAVADDGTAASFNPAGLSQLRQSEISLVGFTSSLRSRVTNAGRGGLPDATQTDRHQAPDFAGLAVPFAPGGRNLTIQISYQRSVDLFGRGTARIFQMLRTSSLVEQGLLDNATVQRLRIPETSNLILDVQPSQKGAFHNLSFAAGYQVTDRLSLGVGSNYWIADWTAQGDSATRIVTPPANSSAPPIDVFRVDKTFHQEHSLRGFNTNAGFLLKFKKVAIGGIARLPFAGDFDLRETGSVSITEGGRPVLSIRPVDVSARSVMRWPRSLGLGLALRPVSKLTLAGDIAKAYWSRSVIEDVPGGALLTATTTPYVDRNFFDLNPRAATSTRDTVQLRAGAEFLITASSVVVPIRAGVYRDRSPISDLGSDQGRRIEGLTAGVGINFASLVLDVGFERRRSSGALGLRPEGVTGALTDLPVESVREDRIVASLLYRFKSGDQDPLKRLFRFLFVGASEADEGDKR